jgi:hypothetical protein
MKIRDEVMTCPTFSGQPGLSQYRIVLDCFVMAKGESAEDWAKRMANTRHIVENCFGLRTALGSEGIQ